MKRLSSVLIVLVLAMAGCGDGLSVQKVTGTVMLDGTPISGASVTFSPVAGGTGMPAVGMTDENGVYTVTYMRGGDFGGGAEKGEYQVGIMWFKASTDNLGESESDADEEGGGGEKGDHAKVVGPDSLLPAAYNKPASSGLTATVAEGDNTFDFDLDSKFKG